MALVMIAKEWKEFYRSSLLVITAALIVVSAWFVLFQYGTMEVPVAFRTGIVSVFQTSVYFLPLIATVYGAFSMVMEKNRRTLPIVLARGMTVQQFVLRKFISIFAIFLPTIIIAYIIAMIPAKAVFGSLTVKEFAVFLFSIMVLAAVFMAIGILLGSVISEKITLIGLIIGTWLTFVYLMDLVLMYWLPSVAMNDVLAFSIVYFLSPIHAVQYFLFAQLDVYRLSDLSALYEQFTFQSPWLVLIFNAILWIGLAIGISIYLLKRKDVSHD